MYLMPVIVCINYAHGSFHIDGQARYVTIQILVSTLACPTSGTTCISPISPHSPSFATKFPFGMAAAGALDLLAIKHFN